LKGVVAYASDETIAAGMHLRLTYGFNMMHTDGESIMSFTFTSAQADKNNFAIAATLFFAVPLGFVECHRST
jgi:hypothetical protein